MDQIINNYKYNKLLNELDLIDKNNKKKLFEYLQKEVKRMCEITNKDKEILTILEEKYNEEKERIYNFTKDILLENYKKEEKEKEEEMIDKGNYNDNDTDDDSENKEMINQEKDVYLSDYNYNYNYNYYENIIENEHYELMK